MTCCILVQYYLHCRFNPRTRAGGPRGRPRALGWSGCGGYPWPGNVRELQSLLKQALLKASGPFPAPGLLA